MTVKVHYGSTTVVGDLLFETGNAVEVVQGGYLRILWTETGRMDTPIGGVAPGWQWYEVIADPEPEPTTDTPAEPASEPDPAPAGTE